MVCSGMSGDGGGGGGDGGGGGGLSSGGHLHAAVDVGLGKMQFCCFFIWPPKE